MCAHVHRFIGDGGHYGTIADGFGIGVHATCDAVHEVARAIVAVMYNTTVGFPENENERFQVRDDFYAMEHMPLVCGKSRLGLVTQFLGAVDGTHVNVMPPREHEGAYVNRHHAHSINCQVVCGPSMQFFDAYINAPGSLHDARVMRRSRIYDRFQQGWRPFPGELASVRARTRMQVRCC